jgi:hypothetical protein
MFTLKIIYRPTDETLHENPNLPAKTENYIYLGDTFSLEYPQGFNSEDPEAPVVEVWSAPPTGCKYNVYPENEAYIVNDKGQTVKILSRGYGY